MREDRTIRLSNRPSTSRKLWCNRKPVCPVFRWPGCAIRRARSQSLFRFLWPAESPSSPFSCLRHSPRKGKVWKTSRRRSWRPIVGRSTNRFPASRLTSCAGTSRRLDQAHFCRQGIPAWKNKGLNVKQKQYYFWHLYTEANKRNCCNTKSSL